MPSLSAEVVTSDQTPLEVGDTVSWRTGTGFRTGGVVHAVLDEQTVRVRVHRGAHSSFGLVTVGSAKLQRSDPR